MAQLSDKSVAWLESRGIWPETAVRCGVYTADIRTAEVIVFPCRENGVVVNEKFRQLPKQKFWQHNGAPKVFWNADVLNDPALQRGDVPLTITEGEPDALTAIQCGWPLTVSVPDGAPPPGSMPDNPDPEVERTGKFAYMFATREQFRKIKRVIIAVDNDEPGAALAEQLVRRIGTGRCSLAKYPDGCKDLNDVLMKHGAEEVSRVLAEAPPYPVHGIFYLDDFPEKSLNPVTSGWRMLDNHFLPFPGELVVLTGIPAHGKSSFCLNLLANLNELHGWKAAIFCPEMSVKPFIRNKLRCIRVRKHLSVAENDPQADRWIQNNFVFIGQDPHDEERDEETLAWVLNRAEDAIWRDNIRVLLIDPWNELEHNIPRNMTVTEYIGAALREIGRFARKHGLVVIVTAHPTKLRKKDKGGAYVMPDLYDISDSSHWYNKCDHGIVIYRDATTNTATVSVVKVRFEETGSEGRGYVNMQYDRSTRRYEQLDYQPNKGENDGFAF